MDGFLIKPFTKQKSVKQFQVEHWKMSNIARTMNVEEEEDRKMPASIESTWSK